MLIKTKDFTQRFSAAMPALGYLAAAAASFIACCGHIGEYPSLFCAGIAALFPMTAPVGFLAALLHMFIFSTGSDGLINACGVLLVASFEAAFLPEKKRTSPAILAALTAGVLLVLSFSVSAAASADPQTVTFRAVASLMSACTVYATRALLNDRRDTGAVSLGGSRTFLLAAVYIAVISTLSSVTLLVFDIGRAAGCTALLFMARRYKMSGGAAMGALTCCAVLIGAPPLAINTMLLATAGLICGAFTELGVLALCISFIAVCAVGLLTVGGSDSAAMFLDAALGTVIYAAMPQGALRRISSRLFIGKDAADTVTRATAARLGFAASSLGEIRSRLTQVSSAMDKKSSRESLSAQVFEEMCRSCENRCLCHREPDSSAAAFQRLEQLTMKYNGLTDSDVRRKFKECAFPELVSDSFNYAYKQLLEHKAEQLRVSQLRSVVSDQLEAMEHILGDLSVRVGQVRSIDRALSDRVSDWFSRSGCRNARACVYLDPSGFCHAEVFTSNPPEADPIALSVAVSDITDCMMGLPVFSRSDRLIRIELSEQPAYEITDGSFFAASSDNGYSGDTYRLARISPCECAAVLSDGMGTGKRAKLDSMFAVSLAEKLLTAGVSAQSALGLINSMLRVKGWDESFATMDIVRFDLCAGTAELMKAGAAPTYLFRDGAVMRFSGDSMPAGILERCAPDIFHCKLFDGDILLMTSDGVDEQTLREALRSAPDTSDPEQLSAIIGELAMDKAACGHRDDISVAAFRITLSDRRD